MTDVGATVLHELRSKLTGPRSAKAFLDDQELLRFALQRMRATSSGELSDGELSWERYFEVVGS